MIGVGVFLCDRVGAHSDDRKRVEWPQCRRSGWLAIGVRRSQRFRWRSRRSSRHCHIIHCRRSTWQMANECPAPFTFYKPFYDSDNNFRIIKIRHKISYKIVSKTTARSRSGSSTWSWSKSRSWSDVDTVIEIENVAATVTEIKFLCKSFFISFPIEFKKFEIWNLKFDRDRDKVSPYLVPYLW